LNCNEKYFPLQNNPYKCVLECPPKTWKNYFKKNCSICNESCKNCNDDTRNCLECEIDYFPLEDDRSLCFKKCPVGYILNDLSENIFCKKCSSNCENCDLKNNCLLCTNGFLLNIIDNKCYSSCIKGYYGDSPNRICKQCIEPCLDCSSSNVCLTCVKGFFIDPLFSDKNCVKTCTEGYWPNDLNNKCEICDTKCKICSSKDKCQSCKNEFYYIEDLNMCVNNCPINKYYSFKNDFLTANLSTIKNNESLQTCQKCSLGCLTCKDLKDNCLSCDVDHFLISKNNKCVSKCPENYYTDFNKSMCKNCDISCKSCRVL